MEKTITFHEREIFYSVQGKGKPVMLVHGFGEDGTVWNNQVAGLEKKYRVIIPDLPGSGRSETTNDLTMEGMAEVIHAILLQEEISLCTIIGHSMGGYILLAFAEKYGDKLDSFGLFHSSAFADSEEKKETRKKGIAFIREHGGFEFLKTATPNLFSPKTKKEKPELVESQVAAGKDFSGEALVAYYEGMMKRPDRTKVLKEALVPVLFVIGRHDQAVPVDDSMKQTHLPNISVIHTLEDSGHMGMLEEVQKSNAILEEFLDINS